MRRKISIVPAIGLLDDGIELTEVTVVKGIFSMDDERSNLSKQASMSKT